MNESIPPGSREERKRWCVRAQGAAAEADAAEADAAANGAE